MNKVPIIRSKPLTRPLKPSAAAYIPHTIQTEKPRQKRAQNNESVRCPKNVKAPHNYRSNNYRSNPYSPNLYGPTSCYGGDTSLWKQLPRQTGRCTKGVRAGRPGTKATRAFCVFPLQPGLGEPHNRLIPRGLPLKFYEETTEGLGAGAALVSLLLICPAGTGS